MGPGSREFAKRSNPQSIWHKRLMYYIATVDYTLMRRDVKKVAEWDIARIIPCHGDVIEKDGHAAWSSLYEWYLTEKPRGVMLKKLMTPVMKLARRIFLM